MEWESKELEWQCLGERHRQRKEEKEGKVGMREKKSGGKEEREERQGPVGEIFKGMFVCIGKIQEQDKRALYFEIAMGEPSMDFLWVLKNTEETSFATNINMAMLKGLEEMHSLSLSTPES